MSHFFLQSGQFCNWYFEENSVYKRNNINNNNLFQYLDDAKILIKHVNGGPPWKCCYISQMESPLSNPLYSGLLNQKLSD